MDLGRPPPRVSVVRLPVATLVFCSCLAIVEPCHGLHAQALPCPRDPERSHPVGSVTEIRDSRPPCRIEFRETGVRLEAVADGSRPDPGRTVLLDSNGRFISANASGWNAVISVWDARGRYLSSFGGAGEGPGELSPRGMLRLFIDGRDSLHVGHGFGGWSVFSPRLEFIRQLPRQDIGGQPWTTVILDDGWVLDSQRQGTDGKNLFRMVDSNGSLARTFGTAGDRPSGDGLRRISHAGGDTFWAGPGEEGADAYVLEEWGTDGTLLRTLHRDVSWYRWRGQSEISPQVGMLHVARSGLLYSVVFRPTEEYVKAYERVQRGWEAGVDFREMQEQEERMEAAMEVIVEVIDTRSGELLASDPYMWPEAREIIPRGLFRGSLRGYRYQENEGGLPFVEIVSVELVAR